VAHHLVAKHGGTLSVTNKDQGTGTVFTIALPLAAVGTDDRRRASGTTSAVS
jgi:signal transduction histidine kinase